jgi:hypothetical protein
MGAVTVRLEPSTPSPCPSPARGEGTCQRPVWGNWPKLALVELALPLHIYQFWRSLR